MWKLKQSQDLVVYLCISGNAAMKGLDRHNGILLLSVVHACLWMESVVQKQADLHNAVQFLFSVNEKIFKIKILEIL